jgi:hypothetical protein
MRSLRPARMTTLHAITRLLDDKVTEEELPLRAAPSLDRLADDLALGLNVDVLGVDHAFVFLLLRLAVAA